MQPLRPIVSAGGPGGRDFIAIVVLCAAGALAAGTLLPAHPRAAAPQLLAPTPEPPPAAPDIQGASEPAPDRSLPATETTDPAPDAAPTGPRTEPAPDRAGLKRLSDSALRRRAATRRETTSPLPAAPEPTAHPASPPDPADPQAPGAVTLRRLGAVALPGAEIPAFDPAGSRVFVSCAQGVAILALHPDGAPTVERVLTVESMAGGLPAAARPAAVTHVEADPANRGFIAALLAPAPTSAHAAPGAALFLSTQDGSPIASLPVGFGPDACAFNADGAWLVVANEGEPGPAGPGSADDPPGSVTVIDLRSVGAAADLASLAADSVRNVPFSGPEFDRALATGELRLPDSADPALAIEPESVTIAAGVAYLTLQENNALAALDVERARWLRIAGLGEITQTIDSRDDGRIEISDTLRALPCPDGVACFTRRARTFLVTANEGDARDDQETEAARATGLTLGARSLTVWDAHSLALVGDTGSAFEWAMANQVPEWFNATNDRRADARSTHRGPEPEGLALWDHADGALAFVSLERPGAVAVIDLSTPESPRLIHLHVSARDGDFGPEGLTLIEAPHSPTGAPLLLAAYEASGTLVVYEIVTGG